MSEYGSMWSVRVCVVCDESDCRDMMIAFVVVVVDDDDDDDDAGGYGVCEQSVAQEVVRMV